MIENAAISPFADERRNKAKVDLFLKDGTLLRECLPKEVPEISLVQEFYKKQTAIPRSEINITFDNRDKYFDITNPESAFYSLTNNCYCEAYFSSVENSASDSFIKKCRHFYNDFSESSTSFSLKFVDAVSSKSFDSRYITAAFDGSSSATLEEILEGVKDKTNCIFEYELSEEMSERSFTRTSFMNADQTDAMKIKEGLHDIARRLSSSSEAVYLMPDRDGKLTFRKQQSEVAATITRKHFINCEFKQGEDCLISVISDRGNILYQLGDIIEVVNGSKTFKTEIYKIHYKLSNNGSLSSEWEGAVV